MCGIVGLIYKNEKIDKDLFDKMLDLLAQRGPDDRGTYFEERIALGNRRLAIIDLTPTGHQPMFNEKRDVVIVFNGEIYNYKKVKNDLKKQHRFMGNSDTEILLHLYEEKGSRLVEEIEGMFAFAIYDKSEKIITLARDHFGKKPLYYYFDDSIFAFASELKSLLRFSKIKNKLTIDRTSLTKFLFYGYVPSPHTIFSQVKKLEPASFLQFDIDRWQIAKHDNYWDLPYKTNTSFNEEEILLTTEKLLKQSLTKRIIADVPVGIYLSGGVDSSLLTCLLTEISSSIEAYTVRYEEDQTDTETHFAEEVADIVGIKINIVNVKKTDILESFITMQNYLSEPIVDPSIYPLYCISKSVREKIKVVLSGDGGDEIFGGYGKYNAQNLIDKLTPIPNLGFVGDLLKNSLSFAPFIKNSTKEAYKKFFNNFKYPYYIRQFIYGSGSFEVEEVRKLTGNFHIDLEKIFEDSLFFSGKFNDKDRINKSLYLDCKIQLPDWYLTVRDRATMAASVEMRNPYLDKTLAEFVFQIDGNYKIRSGINKYITKTILAKYIPPYIVYRLKRGFEIPFHQWIRKSLKNIFIDYLNDPILKDYFKMTYIKQLLKEHLSGQKDNQFKLLRIFNFIYWLRKYYAD